MVNFMTPVKFNVDTIYYIEKDGEMFVPMKPIIENMGIDWAGQYTKLVNARNRWSVEMISIVAQDGRSREHLCIPFRKLASFLAGINPDKVKPELRDKIVQYQEECDNVLYEYWSKTHAPAATQPRAVEMTPSRYECLRMFYRDECGITGPQLAVVINRAWNNFEQFNPLALGEVAPAFNPEDDRGLYRTVTQIAKLYGQTAQMLNRLLTEKQLQIREEKKRQALDKKTNKLVEKTYYEYYPTEEGKQHGGKRFPDSARGNVNKDVWTCMWHKDKIIAWLDKFWKKPETSEE